MRVQGHGVGPVRSIDPRSVYDTGPRRPARYLTLQRRSATARASLAMRTRPLGAGAFRLAAISTPTAPQASTKLASEGRPQRRNIAASSCSRSL